MFRMWGKLIRENRLQKDIIIQNNTKDTRTHKVMDALEQICNSFDLGKPIWLDANITDFKRHKKTRFRQDHFIEAVSFDYLEIQVIEEDS